MKRFLITLLLLVCLPAQAENMIMIRVNHSFDNSMILIKEKLNEYGYKIAHIQKCDGGLSDFGYKTDMYKSVFYGKFEETRRLSHEFPQVIPYIPLKIAVMKEENSVVIVSLNPLILGEFFPERELGVQFARWESDIRAIFEEVSKAPVLQ